MAIENTSRRQLLRGQFLQSLHSENAKIQGINAIRPPWSVNEADFTDKCTRCGDCILICETQIIVKAMAVSLKYNLTRANALSAKNVF